MKKTKNNISAFFIKKKKSESKKSKEHIEQMPLKHPHKGNEENPEQIHQEHPHIIGAPIERNKNPTV
jgi:hypothetical protein